jgi:hypothetical protein
MKAKKIIVAVFMLSLIGATGAFLLHLKARQRLGEPGVKTRPIPGSANLEVLLPETVPGYTSSLLPEAEVVTNKLPPDTSFGQRIYKADDGFQVQAGVVLMGADRTSIHKPEYCLVGQGLQFDASDIKPFPIHIDRPVSYDLPARCVVASMDRTDADGKPIKLTALYVFWFVDNRHITAYHNQWKIWLVRDFLFTGVLDRWAYVNYYTVCLPEQKEAVSERLKKLIAASVPEFQLVNGAGK